MRVRVGVVVFPGTNCDRDTLHALEPRRRRAGRPVARAGDARRRRRGHPARRLRLRRLPAGRRHRPVQPGHARGRRVRRATAAWSSGSATASRSWPRPGSCPGALLRNASLRFAGQRGRDRGRAARHAVHRTRSTRGGRCACRSPTARAATTPTTRRSTRSSATARSCSATSTPRARPPAGRSGQPERLAARDRRRPERAPATSPA